MTIEIRAPWTVRLSMSDRARRSRAGAGRRRLDSRAPVAVDRPSRAARRRGSGASARTEKKTRMIDADDAVRATP